MKRRSIAIATIACVLIATGATIWTTRAGRAEGRGRPTPFTVRAPDGVRIRVQVLNGTKTRGLARRATMLLRDRGFDVVEVGTIDSNLDTTLVLDLSGHPDWANRVARVLGSARVQARTDSSRYLDIAVVLGSTWRPPAEPLHP